MSDLPEGWTIAAIGDICAQSEQCLPATDEEFTYIDIASIDRDLKIVSEPQTLLGADAPSRARKLVDKGDVLVSMTRPNLNAVALISEKYDGAIASTGFDVLRPVEIDPRWIFAAVRSSQFIDAMTEKVQGALYPAIKSGDIRTHEIPLPPQAEQKRIAQKLDALLAQVDTLKVRIDAIPALLKRFRSSVLAAGVSGRLSESGELDAERSSWTTRYLKDLVDESIVGIVRSASEQFVDLTGRRPYLKMNNINQGWGFNLDRVHGVHVSEEEAGRYEIKKGDWLFNTRNSVELVGKSCIWTGPEGWLFNNNILRIRFVSEVLPEYVEIWFRSPRGREGLARIKSATTSVAAIYQKTLMQEEIELPSIKEQAEIVRRVEQIFAFADQLEAKVATAKQRIDTLTQSILAKAFRGELVPQDPNDEPASVLLERIRAQRAAAPRPTRGRKPVSST